MIASIPLTKFHKAAHKAFRKSKTKVQAVYGRKSSTVEKASALGALGMVQASTKEYVSNEDTWMSNYIDNPVSDELE